MTILGPAKTPCSSCPYRQDVPSGVWHEEEYDKLPLFDVPFGSTRVFACHKADERLCAGWCGTHDLRSLIGFRTHVMAGHIPIEEAQKAIDYVSPVPLWSSGQEAAEHGKRDIEDPSYEARVIADRITPYAERNLAKMKQKEKTS